MSLRRSTPTFAWFVLSYTVLVIVFGAWVRVTGSGAGCGQHWPTCHGEIAHRPASLETAIELTHRVSSGLDGLLVIALVVVMVLRFPRAHLARRASWWSLLFVITEGLVGALLVKAELVANDASVARAVVMSIHLVNTSLLTGAMTVAAWASYEKQVALAPRAGTTWRVALVLGMTLLVMMSGAVTALGDTLYPVVEGTAKLEIIRASQSPTAHFLQRVRVLHPALALGAALAIFYLLAELLRRRPGERELRRHARGCLLLLGGQLGVGLLNIWLSAPGWIQLVHLALATVLWIELVLLAAAAHRRGSPGVEKT